MNPIELLTTKEMARADQLAAAGEATGIALMERAGVAVADCAQRFMRGGARVVVLCGPGKNGGDGFVAARLLRDRGFEVALGLLGGAASLQGDAAAAARRWDGAVSPAAALDLDGADLILDALFGAGLSRDLDGDALALVHRVNAFATETGRPVVCVDVPSGLDGDTGAVRGAAVKARATVTFFRLKPGHYLEPGRTLCGEIRLAAIGIPATVLQTIAPQTFANDPTLWLRDLPVPRAPGNKFSRGHALAVSGSAWSTGAARLSARGALRAGAGLVTLASPRDAHAINAAQLTAIMIRPCDGAADLQGLLSDPRVNAIVMGPGLGVGEDTADLVCAALGSKGEDRALVLDADALTSFSGRTATLAARIEAGGLQVVVTPHEGEFARLFDLQGSKLERARAAAVVLGATVLLKGSDTVVAHPDGRASIGHDAPAWLATAGSGDVLGGVVCGLLAQHMPPFEAASAAVWMHAAAARGFGPGLIAEDIPERLPEVWRDLLGRAER